MKIASLRTLWFPNHTSVSMTQLLYLNSCSTPPPLGSGITENLSPPVYRAFMYALGQ